MKKQRKLHFSNQPDAKDWQGNLIRGGVDCYIRMGGYFIGFARIRRCDNSNFEAYWIEPLIPGDSGWWMGYTSGHATMAEAKAGARKIAETILADLQGVSLIPES